MKTAEHDSFINYEELQQIMDKMIEHCQIAKAECLKGNPDIVILCDNAIEEVGNLLAKAESCIYTFNL